MCYDFVCVVCVYCLCICVCCVHAHVLCVCVSVYCVSDVCCECLPACMRACMCVCVYSYATYAFGMCKETQF